MENNIDPNPLETDGQRKKIIEPNIEKMIETQKREFNKFQLEFTEKVVLFSLAGLGLITALAWDEAFKELFILIIKNLDGTQAKFLYAVSLTVLTTISAILFNKFLKKRRRK